MSKKNKIRNPVIDYVRDAASTAVGTQPEVVAKLLESPAIEQDKAISHQEVEFLEGVQTRVTEHGEVRLEDPHAIFEHLTTTDDERPIKRSQRKDHEIAADTRTGTAVGRVVVFGQPCETHGIPDCTPCRLLAESIRTVRPKLAPRRKKVRTAVSNLQEIVTISVEKLGETDVKRLREEWSSNESSREKKRREAAAATQADKERMERTKRVQLHVIQDVRKEHIYVPHLHQAVRNPGSKRYTPDETRIIQTRLYFLSGLANRLSRCLYHLANFFLTLIHHVLHLTPSVPNRFIGLVYAIQALIRNPLSSLCPRSWSEKYTHRGTDSQSG